MSNWKRLSFGLAIFFVLFAFSIVLLQTISVYFTGSVPPSGLALSFLISLAISLLILFTLIRWRSTHPLLIWLPALFALPLFISVLVGVCPECDWSMKRIELGEGELAVTYQTTAYSGVSQVGVVGEEGLWVADIVNDRVVLLDPQDHNMLREIPVGRNPVGIALGFDSIWTADYSDGTVTRVDVTEGQTRAVIEVGGNPLLLAVGEDAVWLTDQDRGIVSRINPRTNIVEATIRVGSGPVGIAADATGIWVALSEDNRIALVDPTTNKVSQRLDTAGSPLNMTIDKDKLWVVNPSTGHVQRFDMASREQEADIWVDGEPTGIAVDDHYAWVVRSAENDVVRITDNALVGDPLPTGLLPKTLVSDGRGGVWVMEEGANMVSHIVPAGVSQSVVEAPQGSWFTSWLSVTLKTYIIMATYGSPIYLLAGMLGVSLALVTRFQLEKRTSDRIPFAWTFVFFILLTLPLLGAFWDRGVAFAATMAAMIAFGLVVRLTKREISEPERMDTSRDTVKLAAS